MAPTISAQRAALAAAIQAHTKAAGARAAAAQAEGAAWDAVIAARRRVYAAETDLEAARTAASERALGALVAVLPASSTAVSVRQARANLEAAEDELAAAEGAQAALKAQASNDRADWTLLRLQEAASAVVACEARAATEHLAAEIMELQVRLLSKSRELAWLASKTLPLEEKPGSMYGQVLDDATRHALARMEAPPMYWDRQPFWDGPTIIGAAPWEAWLNALMRDASALLPKGP